MAKPGLGIGTGKKDDIVNDVADVVKVSIGLGAPDLARLRESDIGPKPSEESDASEETSEPTKEETSEIISGIRDAFWEAVSDSSALNILVCILCNGKTRTLLWTHKKEEILS